MQQILDGKQHAIIQGESIYEECRIRKQQKILYLCRNEKAFGNKKYYHPTKFVLSNRICINCWQNKQCVPKQRNQANYMHDFVSITEMLKQLNEEQVCPYQIESQFQVGLHSDILNKLYDVQFQTDTTLIFEDGHDLAIQLEKYSSIIITNRILKQICQNMVPNIKQGWEQQLYSKINQKHPSSQNQQQFITQQQYDILLPIVSFNHRFMNYSQEFTQPLNPAMCANIITQCTNAIPYEQFIQYFKSLNSNIIPQQFTQTFQKIDYSNYSHYLDEIYLYTKDNSLKQLLYQWFHLIKLAFEFNDAETINDEQPKHYKLYIVSDIILGSYQISLICLNPSIPINKLLQNGVSNIIITSLHTHPWKTFKAQLDLDFQYLELTPPNQFPIQIISKTQFGLNIDFNSHDLETVTLEISKSLLQMHQQLDDHGLMVLFSSKSFMQLSQETWNKHSIMHSLSIAKDMNWLKYPSRSMLNDAIKLFLNKCRFNSTVKDKMPSIYTHFSDQFLDQLQLLIPTSNSPHLLNASPITVLLIGVPWACQSMYFVDQTMESQQQINFDLKLEWLSAQKCKFDRKYFSLVQAIRNISRLQNLMQNIPHSNLIFLDEKFTWNQLYRTDQQQLKMLSFQELLDNLNSMKNQLIKQEKKVIKIIVPQTLQNSGAKRKIILNKVLLGNFYRNSDPQQSQKQQQQYQSNQIQNQNLEDILGINSQQSQQQQQQQQQQSEQFKDNNEEKCVICWQNTGNQIMQRSSKCGHIACQTCWETWLKTKLECPICRARVRQKFLISQ